MDQLRPGEDVRARRAGSSHERRTILPPPPEAPVHNEAADGDPAGPSADSRGIFGFAIEEVDVDDPAPDTLREPTDVDGRPWWDDEDAAITERPPRFHRTH